VLSSGVEHLLRDVKDTTISTLATEVICHEWIFRLHIVVFKAHPKCPFPLSIKVTSKLAALKGLDARLREIRSYLDLVIDGKLPLNHEILYHLQVSLSLSQCITFIGIK
jgi:26S proteasome regulatory subunit N8